MFRRGGNAELPMASYNSGLPDGSGRAVKMDAPVVRAWKNSSSMTKGSYYWLVGSILLAGWGLRHLFMSHASIILECHSVECILSVTPPGRRGTTEVHLSRNQLLKSYPVKVHKDAKTFELDDGPGDFTPRTTKDAKGKKKKSEKRSKGPDALGRYDSYALVLKDFEKHDEPLSPEDMINAMDNRKKKKKKKPPSVTPDPERMATPESMEPLRHYLKLERNDDEIQYVFLMRQFNLGQTRRRTRTMVSKIEAYISRRRHKLMIRENRNMPAFGIIALVFGLFSLILSLLVGQFYEGGSSSYGGPGSRKSQRRAPQKRNPGMNRSRASRGGGSGIYSDTSARGGSSAYNPGATRRKHY